MGAKTWMLVYANGNVGQALRGGPQLDRDATLQLARSLFPKDKLEPIGDGDLSNPVHPTMNFTLAAFQVFPFWRQKSLESTIRLGSR